MNKSLKTYTKKNVHGRKNVKDLIIEKVSPLNNIFIILTDICTQNIVHSLFSKENEERKILTANIVPSYQP